jgi:RNA polymerase sigma-70 factor (ECF subfamily)
MKLTYTFANGETSEIEVTEDWAAVVMELDRQTYNLNQKETRRHCSLDAYNLDDSLLPSGVDVEAEVILRETEARIMAAIEKLRPAQQELIRAIGIKGVSAACYARRTGDTESNVSHKLRRARTSLKKLLD